MPSQYQTMTAASGVMLLEASAQLPTDNTKQLADENLTAIGNHFREKKQL
jgi:hypothetical protein